jgi:hypothetical protein
MAEFLGSPSERGGSFLAEQIMQRKSGNPLGAKPGSDTRPW